MLEIDQKNVMTQNAIGQETDQHRSPKSCRGLTPNPKERDPTDHPKTELESAFRKESEIKLIAWLDFHKLGTCPIIAPGHGF